MAVGGNLTRLGTLISFKPEISKSSITLRSSSSSPNSLTDAWLSLLLNLESILVLLLVNTVDEDVDDEDRRWNQRRTSSTKFPLPIHKHTHTYPPRIPKQSLPLNRSRSFPALPAPPLPLHFLSLHACVYIAAIFSAECLSLSLSACMSWICYVFAVFHVCISVLLASYRQMYSISHGLTRTVLSGV